MTKQKVYFPNLNGIRFIAAFLVIIHHIEQIKLFFNLENYYSVPFVERIGNLGVILFFVLSGFLITYLLLVEEDSCKEISIKEFYIRRILRIWPLYFFILFLAFLVLPNIDIFVLPNYGKENIYSNLTLKLVLYALFLPNLVLSLLGIVPYASVTWSIGTEEQYYLVWPVLLKYVKKHRIFLMLTIIVAYLGSKLFLITSYADFIPYKNDILNFWRTFPIDCMAIGGIYAILLFDKSKFLKYLLRNDLFYFSVILVTLLMIQGVYVPYIHYEFYSVFFGIIILNFSANSKIHISLENRVLNYLGKISYGLYIYHSIGIVLAIAICKSINLISNWLLYPLSFIFAIGMAGLSYRYFESFFIKIKQRFSKISSGNTVND